MTHFRFSFVPVLIVVLTFAVTFCHARYHYQQQDELPSYGYNYNQNIRPHYRGSDLATLNEDELETLLFLLEKAKTGNDASSAGGRYYEKPIPLNLDSAPAKNYFYESRNKRTGHPQKKAIDWEDYFGIDKKKRSPVPQSKTVVGTVHKAPSSHAHEYAHDATTAAHVPVSTTAPAEHEHQTQTQSDAERDKEKEKQIEEFYKNMAFATNMRRKKRDVSSTIALKKVSAAIVAPQVLIPKVMDATPTTAAVSAVKDAPESAPATQKVSEPQADGGSISAVVTTPAPVSETPVEIESNGIDESESNKVQFQLVSNKSENENVFLTTPTPAPVTTRAPTTRMAAAAASPAEMSRGDLEKLKAKLIKQINAAYSIEQLRQVLRDGSLAN